MPTDLRYYFINRMCRKYGCTIWKYPFYPGTFVADVWYECEGGSRWVGAVHPRDYWENIERAVVEYSMIGTFR